MRFAVIGIQSGNLGTRTIVHTEYKINEINKKDKIIKKNRIDRIRYTN